MTLENSDNSTPKDEGTVNKTEPNEPELVGFEEEYSNLSTSQIRIAAEAKRRQKREEKKNYANTVKFRRKSRAGTFILSALALLATVLFLTINLSSTQEREEILEETPETVAVAVQNQESAKTKAVSMLNDLGNLFYYQISDLFGSEEELLSTIETRSQDEGTILTNEQGDNYIISGEIANIPSDFNIEDSVNFFTEPLKDEPLWSYENLEVNEQISANLMPGDKFLRAIKMYGIDFADGTPTGAVIIYAEDPDGNIRVRIDVTVLIIDKADEQKPEVGEKLDDKLITELDFGETLSD